MQLIRTSFNLRSDLPWNIVYRECIYSWIASYKDRRGKKTYEQLLRRLPRDIPFSAEPFGHYEFAGDKLEYYSFTWDHSEYIGFTFIAKNVITNRIWKTQIALKRTDKHVLCFVSQDCDLGRDKTLPQIESPYIIDLLTNFQDGDGSIEIKKQAHILEPGEIDKAKNALTGQLRNVLPIVYLSCSERTHSLKPSIVADKLFGIAHVFAEKDSSLRERLAQEVKGKKIPQGGEIGICHANEPIIIFNRHDVVDWVEKPETLVQDIFLKILKANLSLKFNFTWDAFLTAREEYEKELIERERIQKINSLNEMQREWQEARQKSRDMSFLVEKLMNDLKRVTQERDQYKDEHAKYDSLQRKYDNCEEERKTWEKLAIEADEKREKAEKNLTDVKDQLHLVSTTTNALKQNLDSKNSKSVRYLPLLQPAEKEMYPNEYVCQLVRILNLALPNVPGTDKSPKIRTKSFIEDILAANPEAIQTFKKYEGLKRDFEQVAKQEGLQGRNGAKVMKPFNMEISTKGNNHGKIRFSNDTKERFIGTEASSGSDSVHGALNEVSDVTKALLW